jgi:polar amino acid transport system substrate-binding protein
MKLKKFLGMMAVLTACVTIAACGQKTEKDSWPEIQKKKEVVIGFDNTFVPMGFKDENGKILVLILISPMLSLKNMMSK